MPWSGPQRAGSGCPYCRYSGPPLRHFSICQPRPLGRSFGISWGAVRPTATMMRHRYGGEQTPAEGNAIDKRGWTGLAVVAALSVMASAAFAQPQPKDIRWGT